MCTLVLVCMHIKGLHVVYINLPALCICTLCSKCSFTVGSQMCSHNLWIDSININWLVMSSLIYNSYSRLFHSFSRCKRQCIIYVYECNMLYQCAGSSVMAGYWCFLDWISLNSVDYYMHAQCRRYFRNWTVFSQQKCSRSH